MSIAAATLDKLIDRGDQSLQRGVGDELPFNKMIEGLLRLDLRGANTAHDFTEVISLFLPAALRADLHLGRHQEILLDLREPFFWGHGLSLGSIIHQRGGNSLPTSTSGTKGAGTTGYLSEVDREDPGRPLPQPQARAQPCRKLAAFIEQD